MTTPGEGMFVGRALFSESDDALLLVIDRGVIESANAAATRLFGYDVGGLDGMELACLIAESARSDHDGMVREHFDAPEMRLHGVLELSAVRRDGSEFAADVFLFPFTRDGQQVVLVGVFELAEQVEIEAKYEGYFQRQRQQVEKFRRSEDKKIPPWLDYREIPELRNEAREKLSAVGPASIGQASRIAGISPADIAIVLVHVEGRRRAAAQAEDT